MKKATKKPVKETPQEPFNFFAASGKVECLAIKIAQVRCLIGVLASRLSEDTIYDEEANCLWLTYDLLEALDNKVTSVSEGLMEEHRKTL